jgi:hypothetical protein
MRASEVRAEVSGARRPPRSPSSAFHLKPQSARAEIRA